jgi:hypothetical protein
VQFSQPNSAIHQSNPGDAFHLPPAALAKQAAQPWQLPNATTGGDRLDVVMSLTSSKSIPTGF